MKAKKLTVLAASVMLSAVILTSCGLGKSYAGTWTSESSSGYTYDLDLRSDGKCVITEKYYGIPNSTYEGTWTETDDGVAVTHGLYTVELVDNEGDLFQPGADISYFRK